MSSHYIERSFSLLLLGLGLHIVYQAVNYGYAEGGVPGPGFFPFWVGLLLALCSAVTLYKSFALSGARRAWVLSPVELAQVLAIIAAIAGFILLAPHIGMVVAAAFAIIATGLTIRGREIDRVFVVKLIALGILTSLACYVIFARVLSIPIP